MSRELTACQTIERSILKRYRKEIWQPFIAAVKRYELVQEGDRIAVCISGGKDSMLMAKLMQELQRHSPVHFECEFLVMDPGYHAANRQKIIDNAALLNIPIRIFDSDIFQAADSAEKNPCYLCARMRRGFLYSRAQELHCNKIALGHHFDDVIETTLMALLYGAQIQGMLPKLHSTNFSGMTLIRPMYCIKEHDILSWCRYNDLSFIQCACRFTERSAEHEELSKRREIKYMIAEMKKKNPSVDQSIFKAIHGVQLDTMPGYKTGGELHSFLEAFNRNLETAGEE